MYKFVRRLKTEITILKNMRNRIKPKITIDKFDLSFLEDLAYEVGFGIRESQVRIETIELTIKSYIILEPVQYLILFTQNKPIMMLTFNSRITNYESKTWYGTLQEIEYDEEKLDAQVNEIEDRNIIKTQYDILRNKGIELIKSWTHHVFQSNDNIYIFEFLLREKAIEKQEIPNFMIKIEKRKKKTKV